MFNPPKEENICDTGCGELVQRPDDTPEVVSNRIKTYHELTSPLVAYYQDKGNIHNIDGNVSIEQVCVSLKEVIDSKIPA